ncbi:ADP-ribosylglycohydrolase family protein [Streptomyces abyssomicinicus]|uniref:ADP-ribosylglycohydrolase family protein n=1 Tax=Streptomyces abyssomicinicus TaxID=574929 RepID=UPI0013DECFCE|nr:ADP-ribosylglycohydrolase family protein [Streptomyces abyssomicinicus]
MGGRAVAGAWGRAELQDFRSRVRGVVLGTAVGDALGAPLDGQTAEEIAAAHGPEGLTAPVPAYGRLGAVTDVTQLSLFTVDGLIRAQVRRDTGAWHPPSDLHRAWRRWTATQHDWGPDERRKDDGWLAREEWLYARRAPHRPTLLALRGTTMGTPADPRNPGERGPHAAARSAAFGLLVGWEPRLVAQLAVECATQTHGHPTAYLAAGAYAVTVHGLARGEALPQAVRTAIGAIAPWPGHQEVTGALEAAEAAAEPPAPLEADAGADEVLAAAVRCALGGEDTRHALCLAVNLGGPASVTGALTGGLLGALHGETALPPAWLAELEGRPTLVVLADDFAVEMTQGPALHGPSYASPGWLARYPRGPRAED